MEGEFHDMELIERIFQGTMEEFRDNGVKFTMDGVAKRIGISKRTLYETIPSKTMLIEMAIDRSFQDVKRQQKEIFSDKSLSTVEKLKRLFTIVPTYSKVLDYRKMNEIHQAYPLLYKKIEFNLETDWGPTILLLQQAMDEGVIQKKNIVILRMLLTEIFERLIHGDVLIQNNISYEEAMKEVISIIFDGLIIEN